SKPISGARLSAPLCPRDHPLSGRPGSGIARSPGRGNLLATTVYGRKYDAYLELGLSPARNLRRPLRYLRSHKDPGSHDPFSGGWVSGPGRAANCIESAVCIDNREGVTCDSIMRCSLSG